MAKSLSTLAVGTKFEVPVKTAFQSILGSKVVFKMADKNHTGYPSGAVTLITDRIIALLPFDAKEPSNSNSDPAELRKQPLFLCKLASMAEQQCHGGKLVQREARRGRFPRVGAGFRKPL